MRPLTIFSGQWTDMPLVTFAKKAASWRRVARAIEKNDFWMSRLSFGETKKDVQRLFELKKKYRNLIRPQDTDSKKLRLAAEKMQEMEESSE